ncbi:MAG: dockerin type I domain-containing protein [Candidatus Poribacteria bacterium]|nr:dockerin type I domain-containing protein [Candidatus Poribacteria bacterium]
MIGSFSPDSKTLATGGHWGRTMRLWDVASGTLKSTFVAEAGGIISLAFSPDGTIVASVSWSGTVLLWDLAPAAPEPPRLAADVNGDSRVNIQDLVAVAAAFGETGETSADVNGDGQVNIQDLVAVAAAFGETAAGAPSASHLSAETVQQWLSAAKQLGLTDTTSQRGIRFLEQLLLVLTPQETALLANYPNPFNPETWIPYQLANPADVTLRIYTIDGSLVRMLSLGHKAVGIYQSRNRAAYWDGKNEVGEPVASGVYFYTLTAGEFNATRKMLIRK